MITNLLTGHLKKVGAASPTYWPDVGSQPTLPSRLEGHKCLKANLMTQLTTLQANLMDFRISDQSNDPAKDP